MSTPLYSITLVRIVAAVLAQAQASRLGRLAGRRDYERVGRLPGCWIPVGAGRGVRRADPWLWRRR